MWGCAGSIQKPFSSASPCLPLCCPLAVIHLQDLERKKPIHNYSSTIRGFRIVWHVSFSSYCCILIPELGRGWEGRKLGKPPCANRRELPLDFFFNCNKKDLDKNDRKHYTHCSIIKASILGLHYGFLPGGHSKEGFRDMACLCPRETAFACWTPSRTCLYV